jgi:hypothetical protein
MKKLLLAIAMVGSLVALGACGGDSDDNASLSGANQAPSVADKKAANEPSGKEATHVGAPPSNPECATTLNADWVNSPENLDEAVNLADTIVVAQVESVQKGEDLVIPGKDEPGGETRVPTSEVKVKVTKSEKGSAKAGDTMTLFQTGDSCQQMDEDPPYKKGQKHLLFLEQGPRGLQRTISPEGRYKENADGTLEPAVEGPATEEVAGKKVKDIEPKLKKGGSS